jgi:hypothetical protein
LGEKTDLDSPKKEQRSDDDPKKEIEAISEIDDEQDIRRVESHGSVDIKFKK